jgi:[NiFe] hydrogenase assembly HybE family chaperone
MPEAPDAVAAAALPSPAAALERRFGEILDGPMHDVPMLNHVLRVQAVGFRPWGPHWLGVLVTPWFMSLLLFPRDRAACHPVGERETRQHVFPAGVFEFIGNRDAVLGDYQACSLFSPMFEFADHATAADTAAASLAALFDAASRLGSDVPAGAEVKPPAATPAAPSPAAASALSKRDFLFGGTKQRESREP